MKAVKRILEVHRNPRLAEDVEHEYGDKYRLVDQVANTALIAQLNELVHFGLTDEVLKAIDKTKPATLRFQASDSCKFLKDQLVEVPVSRTEESDEQTQTSGSSFFGSTTKSSIKQAVNHVREYHWKVEVKWEISLYAGTNVAEKQVLSSRSSSMVVITQSDNHSPLPENRECKPVDLSLTWLVSQIDTEAMSSKFAVDTQHPKTKTPRRNPQVEDAISFMKSLRWWMSGVRTYFDRCVQQDIIDRHNPASPTPLPNPKDRLSALSCDDIFTPVQVLLEETEEGASGDSDPILSTEDMDKFLGEQTRSIQERLDKLRQTYPGKQLNKIVSVTEATIVLLSLHSNKISVQFVQCVDYVEQLLSDQLVAAIGKRVQQSDIDKFMRYHNARLLDPAPQPFCHAIRQPGHNPCGILSIEDGRGKPEPIETLVREVESSSSMMMPLDAATNVELTGKKYLHGWVQQRFGQGNTNYRLIARARQFSSFLLVVGTMAGPDQFDPKDAIIVQNKDELMIPLLLEEIPTAQEFKDAIRSLSPDQQRFAESFRNMQLGSSVMGICVIQIKPQLETLLGLPKDALTKEMKLTQELLELFVEYQVPSDLLSYDGIQDDASPNERVENVRGHVKAVVDVIDEAKKKQLEEQKMKADMALEGAIADEPTRGMPGGASSPFMNKGAKAKRAHAPVPNAMMAMSSPPPASVQTMGAPVAFGYTPAPARMLRQNVGAPWPSDNDDRNTSSAANFQQRGSPSAPLSTAAGDGSIDFTAVPRLLNSAIEEQSEGAAVRSTNVKLADEWIRNRQENLLTKPARSFLGAERINTESNKAFDLLDALSRSGSLPVPFSELHVIVSVTHCFDKDVIGTIIQDNINPIEKLEMSTLLVGSAIHGVPVTRLVRDKAELPRLKGSFPKLVANESEES